MRPHVSCDLHLFRAQSVGPQEIADSSRIPVKHRAPGRQRSS